MNVKEFLDLGDLPIVFEFYGREDMIAKRQKMVKAYLKRK